MGTSSMMSVRACFKDTRATCPDGGMTKRVDSKSIVTSWLVQFMIMVSPLHAMSVKCCGMTFDVGV